MSPRQALVSSKRGVHPSERGVRKRSLEPFVFCRICNREAEYLMKFSLLIASRVSPANFARTEFSEVRLPRYALRPSGGELGATNRNKVCLAPLQGG